MTASHSASPVTSASAGASASSQHANPVLFPTAHSKANINALFLVLRFTNTTSVVLRDSAAYITQALSTVHPKMITSNSKVCKALVPSVAKELSYNNFSISPARTPVQICAFSTKVFIKKRFLFFQTIARDEFSVHKDVMVACSRLFLLENTGYKKTKMLPTPFDMKKIEDKYCTVETSDPNALDVVHRSSHLYVPKAYYVIMIDTGARAVTLNFLFQFFSLLCKLNAVLNDTNLDAVVSIHTVISVFVDKSTGDQKKGNILRIRCFKLNGSCVSTSLVATL